MPPLPAWRYKIGTKQPEPLRDVTGSATSRFVSWPVTMPQFEALDGIRVPIHDRLWADTGRPMQCVHQSSGIGRTTGGDCPLLTAETNSASTPPPNCVNAGATVPVVTLVLFGAAIW